MNVLVIAAHPDDEVLGCGGTIIKHSQQGDVVRVLILAEGATSRDWTRNRETRQTDLSALAKAAHQASEILEVDSVKLLQFPDNRMDTCDLLDIVKVIEAHIQEYLPERIYTHHLGDLNIDHRRISEAVITAARPIPEHPTKSILFFEVPSSTEWQVATASLNFNPNWFVDISNTLNVKLNALQAYQTEIRSYPHPRSLEAVEYLARWRGATVGLQAAEAFVLARYRE
ncbi:MAG: PIG-L family deacetylase [Cyanobacteria bacterium P01_E01_bin.42]